MGGPPVEETLRYRPSDQLLIFSHQRTSGTVTNFTMDFPASLQALKGETIYLSLISSTIPNSFYNINSTNNSFIVEYYKSGGTPETYQGVGTVDPGNYKTISGNLLPAIVTALNNSATNGTVFPNPLGRFYMFYNEQNGTARVYFEDNNSSGYKPTRIIFNTQFWRILGLDDSSDLIFSDITPYTYTVDTIGSDGKVTSTTDFTVTWGFNTQIMTCILTHSLYLQTTNLITSHVMTAKKRMSIIAQIPLTVPPFGFNYTFPFNKNAVEIDNKTFSSLNIRITDGDDNDIVLNGPQWEAILRVDYRPQARM